MDSMIQIQKMSDVEINAFEQEKLRQDRLVKEHLEKRDSMIKLNEYALPEQRAEEAEELEMPEMQEILEMPGQKVNEKEFKQRRREKKQYRNQLKVLQQAKEKNLKKYGEGSQRAEQMRVNNKADDRTEALFSETLSAELFTPRYVQENFAEVRETLDSWKEHLELLGEEDSWLAQDKKLRLVYMRELYVQGEKAFEQALRAMGYEYDSAEGKSRVVKLELDEQQKQQALEENRKLRTQIAKDGAEMDEKTADDLIEKERQKLHSEKAKFRAAETEQASFLNDIRELLRENPERYAQNKEVLDKLYEEAFHTNEVMDLKNERFETISVRLRNRRYGKRFGIQNAIEKRWQEEGASYGVLEKHYNAVKAAISHVLTGSELTEEQYLSVASLLPMEMVHKEAWEKVSKGAKGYAELYRQKEKEAVPEDAAAAKPIVLSNLERIRDCDTRELAHCTDEELIARAEELQELAITAMHLAGAEKLADPDEMGEDPAAKEQRSIREVFSGNNKELFDMKCSVIKAYAEKARALSLIQAYRLGGLNEDCFLQEELDKLYEKREAGQDEPLSKEELLYAAKEMLEKAIAAYDLSLNAYLSTRQGKDQYAGVTNEEENARKAEYVEQRYGSSRENLLDYKQEMQRHYEELEETFRHRIPSVEYVEEHRQELNSLFAGVQKDALLMEKRHDVFDLTKPDDVRLYHLVQVYRAIADYLNVMIPTVAHGKIDLTEAENYCNSVIAERAESFSYLEKPPVQKNAQELTAELAQIRGQKESYARQQDWLKDMEAAESPLLAEKFRRLGADAPDIFSMNEEMMLDYLKGASELAEYVQRYRSVDSLYMRQFRGWLSMAKQRTPMISDMWFQDRMQMENGLQVDKEAEAKRFNPYADAQSFDLLLAKKKVFNRTGQNTFAELSRKLSRLTVTEEMLSPEYMTAHMEELLESFAYMDAYRAIEKEYPAREQSLPAEERLAWSKNRGMYERYRDYVTLFARTHCVDIEEEAYLSGETYEEQKESLTEAFSRETKELQILLGDFGPYAEQLNSMAEWAAGHKEETGKDKTEKRSAQAGAVQEQISAEQCLTSAGQWLEDLIRYMKTEIDISSEDFLDATILTLMSMLGYMEQGLGKARTALKTSGFEGAEDKISQLQSISDTFSKFKERIPWYAREYRELLMTTAPGEKVKLQDVLRGAQGVKRIVLDGGEANVGAGSSDVIRVKEREKNYFFKGNEKLGEFYDEVEKLLPLLENTILQKRFADLIGQAKEDTVRYREEAISMNLNVDDYIMGNSSAIGQIELLISYMERIVNYPERFEESTKLLGESLGMSVSGYARENPEKWKEFCTQFIRKNTANATARGKELQYETGTDLTARNYASERIAELFGLKNILVHSTDAVIVDRDGVQRKGFIMEQAKGKTIAELHEMVSEQGEYSGYEIHVSGEAQKLLLNLQIMDNIVGQIDRHEGNYFLDYEVDEEHKQLLIKDVTGIDNDFSFGKSEQLGGAGTGSVLNFDGVYIAGMADQELYKRIQAVSPELLTVQLEGLIEPEYLEPLVKRYEAMRNKLREAYERAKEEGTDFFGLETGWGEETEKAMRAKKGLFINRMLGKI